MARYLIALGSSHAQGITYLENALKLINQSNYFTLKTRSRIYRNSSFGGLYNSLFYNTVCAVTATLYPPEVLYRELMTIEYSF